MIKRKYLEYLLNLTIKDFRNIVPFEVLEKYQKDRPGMDWSSGFEFGFLTNSSNNPTTAMNIEYHIRDLIDIINEYKGNNK